MPIIEAALFETHCAESEWFIACYLHVSISAEESLPVAPKWIRINFPYVKKAVD